MIAKSNLTALLITILFSFSGYSEIKNIYQQILEDYDIHPPTLKYGYPLWYEYDTVQPTAIIFLKKELDDLHKINKITYVAEPTKENAEIIFNFSGKLPAFAIDAGDEMDNYPTFYIVPDSNITSAELRNFIEYLTPPYCVIRIMLVGNSGNFAILLSDDMSIWIPDYSYHYTPDFWSMKVLMNGRREMMLDSWFLKPDSISNEIQKFYWDNFSGLDKNARMPFRHILNLEYVSVKLSLLRKALENSDEQHKELYQFEIGKFIYYEKLVKKYGEIRLLPSDEMIQISIQGNSLLVSEYYRVLDIINKGVYISRERRSNEFFQTTYLDLILSKRFEDLQFIHLEFPDRTIHYFYSILPDDEFNWE